MNWFYQQSRRDQIALVICAICVALYLVWMAGIKPLAGAAEMAENRQRAASETLARVKTLAATLQHHQATAEEQPQSRQVSIAGLIDTTTASHGLSFTTLNPSRNGQEATVRFDNASLANVVGWLHELETAHSTQVEDLNLVAGNQSGRVMVTVRLRKQ